MKREWGRWAADTVAVALAVIAAVVAFQAKSGEVSRAHDATLPCAQAKHPSANVLCIVGAELDRRSSARDKKEAAAAAAAAKDAAVKAAKFRRDICALLLDLPHTKDTDAVRIDLKCTGTPAQLSPTPASTSSAPATPPSPTTAPTSSAGPKPTPAGTGAPTPPAARSSTPVATSPPAPQPSPTRQPLLCPVLRPLIGCS